MTDNKSSNPFMDMFQQFGQNLKLPTPEISSVMEAHQKNLQALQAAAQAQSAGAQNLMEKQREVLEKTLEEIATMVQDTYADADPTKAMNNQMEFARKSLDMTIRNTAEMGEIIRDAGAETFEVLKARVEESIAEMQGKAND